MKNFTVPFMLLFILWGCGSGDGPGVDETSGQEQADAVLDDISVAYIRRTIPESADTGDQNVEVESFLNFEAYRGDSAAVFIRNRANVNAIETRVTPEGVYDVRQLSVGYDGETLLFSMRGPMQQPNEEENPTQPAWGIWEYTISSDELIQLTEGDADNHIHDIDPSYLVDGRIIFSSSRQRTTQAKLGDEGKPQYRHLTEDRGEGDSDARTFNLHILGTSRDENSIEQVTFNQSHDFNPVLDSSGRVVFSRWDNNGVDSVSLYRMNPDGSQMELLFGHNSQNAGIDPEQTVRYTRPLALDDGRILSQLKSDRGRVPQVQFALLDVENFIDVGVPITGSGAVALEMDYLEFTQTVENTPTLDGRLSAITPADDGTGRYIISWSLCELVDQAGDIHLCTEDNLDSPLLSEATPFYGLFMFDPEDRKSVPIVLPAENVVYTDIVIGQAHDLPVFVPDIKDSVINEDQTNLVDEEMGVLHIRSVYNIDGVFDNRGADSASTLAEMKDPSIISATDRPARFIRISKQIPFWDDETRDISGALFGVGEPVMREIIGYSEVEPDGSVMVKVPADIAFTFSLVDSAGARLSGESRHNNWMQLRPGEALTCNGCHDHSDSEEVAHGRSAILDSVNTGAANDGAYPNADPALSALLGETMAQTRARVDPASMNLSPNLVFVDAWATQGNKEDSYSYTYDALIESLSGGEVPYPAPVNFTACLTEWTTNCRVVVNYPEHIQPLWNKQRLVQGKDGTCVSCHNYDPDPNNGNTPRTAGNSNASETPGLFEPAVQQAYLGEDANLPGAIPAINANRMNAYDHLLNTHPRAIVEAGVLQQQIVIDLVPRVDEEGNPVFEQIPVLDAQGNPVLDQDGAPTFSNGPQIIDEVERGLTLSRSMVAGNAIGSRFFEKLQNAPAFGETDHRGWMTNEELKLLNEWVDLGGKYYNSPFDAPEN